jgi:serine/threonine protein kinase
MTAAVPPDEVRSAAPGKSGGRLGPYVLGDCLARTHVWEYWSARGPDPAAEPVAVRFPTDPRLAAHWRTAGLSVPKLEHSRLIRTLSVELAHDPPYAVTEEPGGESLRAVLDRDGPLPPERAVRIAGRLLETLQHIHDDGLVHREIRPENVWISEDGRTKLAGLGLGGAAERYAAEPSARGSPDASPGGVAAYLAPEQQTGKAGTAASDQYAIGLLMYEMLTGETRRLRFPIPKIPDWLSSVVETATRRRPEERYGSAREMHTQLDGKLPAGNGDHRRRVRRRRREDAGPEMKVNWVGLSVLLVGALAVVYGLRWWIEPSVPVEVVPIPPSNTGSAEPVFRGHTMREWGERLPFPRERKAAAEALSEFGAKAVPILVRDMAINGEDPMVAAALWEIGPDGLGELDALAEDRDIAVRRMLRRARELLSRRRPRPDTDAGPDRKTEPAGPGFWDRLIDRPAGG